ncbi:MAG: hypothetical protein GTO41_22250, partial [Burkholderiales bacterium]|nr:hypothetical protein [Burkholderiales bacterium]
MRRHQNTDGFEDAALERLATDQLNRIQLRSLLGRLRRPDVPGLVQLVVRDLSERDSGGFGSLAIHRRLTIEQLDQCARLRA